jgi:hypothetical protein
MGDLLGSLVWRSQKRTILCRLRWDVTNGIRTIAQPEMGGSVHKPMRVASGHLLGCQECGDPMRVSSGDAKTQEDVIVTSHIAWELGCAYMYKHTFLDTTRFKGVMTMNLSELRS